MAKKLKAGEKPSITETQFGEVNALMLELTAKEAAADKAKAEADEVRARMLAYLTPFRETAYGANIFAGVTVSEKLDVDYDDAEALTFLTAPAYLVASAPYLTLNESGMARVVALAATDQTVKEALAIYPAGYRKAVLGKAIFGLPYDAIRQSLTLSVSSKALKSGDALRETLNVIPDAPAIVPDPTPTITE